MAIAGLAPASAPFVHTLDGRGGLRLTQSTPAITATTRARIVSALARQSWSGIPSSVDARSQTGALGTWAPAREASSCAASATVGATGATAETEASNR